MRLRSSQFVFLLLLACSAGVQENHVLRMLASPTLSASQLRETATAPDFVRTLDLSVDRPARTLDLAPQQSASTRTVWAMPQPDAAALAVNSFTGLRRG